MLRKYNRIYWGAYNSPTVSPLPARAPYSIKRPLYGSAPRSDCNLHVNGTRTERRRIVPPSRRAIHVSRVSGNPDCPDRFTGSSSVLLVSLLFEITGAQV